MSILLFLYCCRDFNPLFSAAMDLDEPLNVFANEDTYFDGLEALNDVGQQFVANGSGKAPVSRKRVSYTFISWPFLTL